MPNLMSTETKAESLPKASAARRFVAPARFWDALPEKKVRCMLCPRLCAVSPGQRGHCGVRENRDGQFFSLVYGRVCTAHVDPIEKKPFFHVLPGTTAFSVATAGCNVNCTFCQNADLSQARPEDLPAELLGPREVALLARHFNCPSIACTYGEPTVFAEFAMDTAEAAQELGIRSLIVSNGYIQPEALLTAYARMDAVKIDLKAFTEKYYREVVRARLKPVLKTIELLRRMDKWVELVYLLVPTLNDGDEELRAMARWIRTNLGADLPLHFSRFHPDHQLRHLPMTPLESLDRAHQIARAEGLHYVYVGNVPGHPAQHTRCPHCGATVVERTGFAASAVHLQKGCCAACGQAIAGLWQ